MRDAVLSPSGSREEYDTAELENTRDGFWTFDDKTTTMRQENRVAFDICLIVIGFIFVGCRYYSLLRLMVSGLALTIVVCIFGIMSEDSRKRHHATISMMVSYYLHLLSPPASLGRTHPFNSAKPKYETAS